MTLFSHIPQKLIGFVIVLFAISLYFIEWPSQTSANAGVANTSFQSSVVAYSRRSNSVVFHPASGKIYASIPSSTDELGNSVVRIDPDTGTIEKSVWVGSEPGKMVLAPDGNTLYVALDGSRAIRKIDLSTNLAGSQFNAGFTTSDGPQKILDITVSGTDVNLVAVSRNAEATSGSRQVAVFQNGIRLANTGGSSSSISFGATDSIIWGVEYDSRNLQAIQVGISGITSSSTLPLMTGRSLKFVDNRIYASNGQIFDSTGLLLGTFAIRDAYTSDPPFVVDLLTRRALYVSHGYDGIEIRAFDIDTFVLIGTTSITSPVDDPKSLARWGNNGLAISFVNSPTLFVRSELAGGGPIGTPAPIPSATPIRTWPASFRRIDVPANALVLNPTDEKLYVTVPSTAGAARGNTITRIDPTISSIISSTFIGSEPNRLAVSTDGSVIYASLAGANAIRKFNPLTLTPGLQFSPANPTSATRDMVVPPGIPNSVIVSNVDGQVSVYDEGIKRPLTPNVWARPIEFDPTSGNLYGYNDVSSGFNLYRMSVGQNGLSVTNDVQNLLFRFNVDFRIAAGRIFSTDGRVIDPETSQILGTLNIQQFSGRSVAYDSQYKRIYVLTDGSIEVFNAETFNKLGKIAIPYTIPGSDTYTDIVRWGENGLAFGIKRGQAQGFVVTVRSPLISPVGSLGAPYDFDGDGRTDLSIVRPNGSNGAEWWWTRSYTGGNGSVQFGGATDVLSPADFTGDGKTDVAFWRPSTGQWFVLRSEDFSFYAFPFGATGDVPVPADYDGDGKADAAVFRESAATWYISRSSGGTDIVGFGAAGDKPVNADYDGDGKADIAIFRPSGAGGAEWWVRRSSNASVFALQFGSSTDKAVPGDFTGDGKADVAFWRPSTGFWNVLRSEDFSYYAFPFGVNGDIASPGDYDGDGKLDAAVFRPSSATWFANRSTAGTLIQQFGQTGDVPVPSAFVR